MLALKLSRDLCGLVAFSALIIAPVFANAATDEMVPWFCAALISSAIGFIVFDMEVRKARREMDSGE